MKRQKNLPTALILALGICLLSLVGQAAAIGFGELDLESYLNQPFDATVELLGTEDVRNLSVELAGPTRYQRMNLSPPRSLGDYAASLSLRGGQNVVRLSSRKPVTDLVIDLVLVINADGSESVRHYPIIIDFAPQLDGVVVSPAPARDSPAPEPIAVPAPRRTVAAVRSANSYGPVQAGQTLSGIVSEVVAEQDVNGYDFMQAIVDLNPAAFANGDMNRMRAGVSLALPDLAGFSPRALAPSVEPTPAAAPDSVSLAAPAETADEPVSASVSGVQEVKDPRLELVGTPTSGEILDSLNNWLDEDDAELGVRAQEARRDLAYATAEIETYRKENDVLKDRVGELEDRIASLRSLIALRAAEESDAALAQNDDQNDNQPAAQPANQSRDLAAALADAAAGAAADNGAAAPVSVDSELANLTDPQQQGGSGLGWWPWLAGVLALLIVTLVVWYRGRREDQVRAQRTADLVHRIQQAGKQPTGEFDAIQ